MISVKGPVNKTFWYFNNLRQETSITNECNNFTHYVHSPTLHTTPRWAFRFWIGKGYRLVIWSHFWSFQKITHSLVERYNQKQTQLFISIMT